jgi:hypothetical protein
MKQCVISCRDSAPQIGLARASGRCPAINQKISLFEQVPYSCAFVHNGNIDRVTGELRQITTSRPDTCNKGGPSSITQEVVVSLTCKPARHSF